MDVPKPATSPSSGWLPGLVLGVIDGIALLEIGTVGLALAVATLALVAWKGPRFLALAGFLTGAGLIWTVLFARVGLACLFDAQLPGEDCSAPLIGPWTAIAAVTFVTGLATSALALRRRRDRS